MTLTRTHASAHEHPGAGPRCRSLAASICVVFALVLVLAAQATAAGYRDFSYGTVSAPTADKPQSKLWFNDGSWYGTLWNKSYIAPGGTTATGRYEIHKLSWQGASQSWSSTGVPVDTRRTSHSDAASSSSHVWIASAVLPGSPDPDDAIKLFRYTYDAAAHTYSLDSGYPVTVANAKVEAIGIARDSTGVLWMTWTTGNQVYVTHTSGSDDVWVPAYVLPAPNAADLDPDDISSIVAYDGRIGVLWSRQSTLTDDVVGFASHADGAGDGASDWTYNENRSGPLVSDDHMNLKPLPSGDPAGQMLALTKTSETTFSPAGSPLIQLDVLKQDGTWAHHTVWTPTDDVTRATLAVDIEHRMLYAFGSTPCCSGGDIVYKKTSLDDIQWTAGLGSPFIDLPGDAMINNPTSTQQNVDSTTGLVVAAADDNTGYYVHNTLDIAADATAPLTEILGGPEEGSSIRNIRADFRFASNEAGVTFECSLDDAAFTPCLSSFSTPLLGQGVHSLRVRAKDDASNVDPNPPVRTWTVDGAAPWSYNPDADALVEAGSAVNRGTLGYLEADGGTHVAETSYLRFAVDDVTGNVSGAKLRVWVSDGASASATGKGTATYEVLDNDWSERGIVDANKPALGPLLEAKLNIAIPGNSYVDYDVSAFVTGNGTYSFAVNTTQTDKLTFDSREGARPPQLLVLDDADTTPPAAPVITSPADGSYDNTGTVTVAGTAEAGATVELFDNSGSAGLATVAGDGTWSLAVAAVDGAHAFTATAVDGTGNTSPPSAAVNVTVDTIAPDTTIAAGPSDPIVSRSATFSLSATEAAVTFECSLDGGTFEPCASPHTYSGLAAGGHSFAVQATDAAGNPDTTPATWTWTVETVALDDTFDVGAPFASWTTVKRNKGGRVVVQSGIGVGGTSAARLSSDGKAGSHAYATKQLLPAPDFTVSADIMATRLVAGSHSVGLLRLSDAGGAVPVELLRADATGGLIVRYNGIARTTGSSLPLNTFGHFEVHVVAAGPGASTIEVKLDGTTIFTTATATVNAAGITQLLIATPTTKLSFDTIVDNVRADI